MKLAQLMQKHAEVAGTQLQPNSAPSFPASAVKRTKVAGAPEFPAGALPKNDKLPDSSMPEHLPQAKAPSPHVDVSNKRPPIPMIEKKASRYALNGRYPLDSLEHVKTASEYFDTYRRHFTPAERREFAVKLAGRMIELHLPVPETTLKYAGPGYAPEHEFKLAMDLRRNVILDNRYHDLLNLLIEKTAELEPEAFCPVLEEFDKCAGVNNYYDGGVPDAYLSTYGWRTQPSMYKTAEEKDKEHIIVGNDMITVGDLRELSMRGRAQVMGLWGEEFADEFAKDPRHIYDTLPTPQKTLMIRMAAQLANGGTPT